jgi:CRP-like cAMP-binding protein
MRERHSDQPCRDRYPVSVLGRVESSQQAPEQNRLLAALPRSEYERLRPLLEPVSLPPGWMNHAGDHKNCLYFLTSGIVARAQLMENGKSTAFAVVGNEGVIGITSFLSGLGLTSERVVLTPSSAYRLRADLARTEFERHGVLADLLLRYTATLMTEIGQNAACNRHHSVDQQLCRWILSFLDRISSKDLTVTQSLIADMLGIRREGVTAAIGKLEKAGLIHQRRGQIAVLDRVGLESRCCECYAIVRSQYDRRFHSDAIAHVRLQRSASRVWRFGLTSSPSLLRQVKASPRRIVSSRQRKGERKCSKR